MLDKFNTVEIFQAFEPRLLEAGFVLRDAQWRPQDKTLCFYIENSQSTLQVSIEDCAKVSRLLATDNDLDNYFEGPYSLEVSSPGIEPPLRTLNHFREALGKRVEVTLKSKQRVSGTVENVFDSNMPAVELKLKNGCNKVFELHSVINAKQKFDWENQGESQ